MEGSKWKDCPAGPSFRILTERQKYCKITTKNKEGVIFFGPLV